MAKIRVHELAKEFGIASKKMAAKIMDLGYNIKNYMSTLEDYEVHDIRRKIRYEADAAAKTKQEAKPKTTVRLRHRKITLRKIAPPSEGKKKAIDRVPEKEAEKPAEIKPGTTAAKPEEIAATEEKAEGAVPVTKEKREIKANGEAPAVEGEQLEIEPRQEVTEALTEAVEESLPEKQTALAKDTPKPKTMKKAGAGKPTSFVKILDRPKIEITRRPNDRPESPVRQTAQPSQPDAPLAEPPSHLIDISAASKKKDRKKGKRVVQMSELGGPLKKRRITPKWKEKQRHIDKIIEEEIDVTSPGY